MTRAVLLANPEPFDFAAVSKVIAQFHSIPAFDAKKAARECWGIVAEDLPEDRADALKTAFDTSGLPAVILDSSSMTELPDPIGISRIQRSPDGLECITRRNESFSLSANALVLISACGYNEDRTRAIQVKEGPSTGQQIASMGMMMLTGLPIRIGPKKQTVEKMEHHTELQFYVDLFESDPSRRFRIDAQNFDYSFLKEKKQYSVLINLKTLLQELVAFGPKALWSRGTHILLDNKPVVEMAYRSLADLDRESRWLLTLQHLNT